MKRCPAASLVALLYALATEGAEPPAQTSGGKESLAVHVQDCKWDGIATVVELTVAGDALSIEPLPGYVRPSIPSGRSSGPFGRNARNTPVSKK